MIGRVRGIGFWFVLSCLIPISCESQPPKARAITAQITVDFSKPSPKDFSLFLGNNVQWVDFGDEILDRKSSDFSPSMLSLAEKLQPATLRYPGGCQADTFHWKQGVGKLDSRAPNERFFDKRKERITFGPTEFLDLCARLKSEPLITVNVATGDESEAAGWVKFANSKEGRVKFWEIGNEPYLKHDAQPKCDMVPEEYARRAKRFIAKMKETDPSIKVGIPLRSDKLAGIPATPHQGFNDKVLSALGKNYDWVALHNGYFPAGLDKNYPDHEYFRAAMAGPVVIEADLKSTASQLQHYRPGENIPMAITEYNALFSIGRRSDAYISSLAGALFVADAIRVYAEFPNVSMTNFWSLTGNWHFGAVSNRQEIRPAYHVLEVYRTILREGSVLYPVQVETEMLTTPRVGFTAAQPSVPAVTALCVRNGRKITVALLHKQWGGEAKVTLAGLGNDLNGKRSARRLVASNPLTPSTDEIAWQPTEIPQQEGPMTLLLPGPSLTLIEIN